MTRAEAGAAAILTAAALAFLLGAAALAVDVSAFQHSARTTQNTADMSCLAGIAEDSDTDRVTVAAAFTKQNWPEMSGHSVTFLDASTGVLTNGDHTVLYQASYGGDPDLMRVAVTEANGTQFGALFAGDIEVSQQAMCGEKSSTPGPNGIPLATMAGSFGGDLFDCAAKLSGNCGAVRVDGNGGDAFRDAMAGNATQDLEKHHGVATDPDAHTGNPFTGCPTAGPCSGPSTETGNMVGPFLQAVALRLSDTSDADCVVASIYNCDSMSDVLGGSADTLDGAFGATSASLPADFPSVHFDVPGWEPSLYGDYVIAKDRQYWYDDGGIKCASPRLVTVPIVVSAEKASKGGNIDWTVGDAATTWPNGNGTMKIVGFYTAYLREPSNPASLGLGGLGKIVVDVVWFGPNATCDDGTPFAPAGATPFTDGVRLTAG